jgi:hypothetical protein
MTFPVDRLPGVIGRVRTLAKAGRTIAESFLTQVDEEDHDALGDVAHRTSMANGWLAHARDMDRLAQHLACAHERDRLSPAEYDALVERIQRMAKNARETAVAFGPEDDFVDDPDTRDGLYHEAREMETLVRELSELHMTLGPLND